MKSMRKLAHYFLESSSLFGRKVCQPNPQAVISVGLHEGEHGCDITEASPLVRNFHVASRQVAITNVLGLHLRAADKFVRLAQAFQSDVKVRSNGSIANGRSVLDLLSLAAVCGTMLAVETQGSDAEDAVTALANLISGQSHESADQAALAAG
jgi:phosphocarrier protein